MTHITTLVPNLPARAPRGAAPLAELFLAVLNGSTRAFAFVRDALRPRRPGTDAAHASPACGDGIGSIKG